MSSGMYRMIPDPRRTVTIDTDGEPSAIHRRTNLVPLDVDWIGAGVVYADIMAQTGDTGKAIVAAIHRAIGDDR